MTYHPGTDELRKLDGYTSWRRIDATGLTDVLSAVTALNEQVLDTLVDSARSADAEFPLDSRLRANVATLTDGQRQQIARCGVCLADAGFADLTRWNHVALAGKSALPPDDGRPWLSSNQSVELAYAVLMMAWHVVHRSPGVAGVLLGMTEPVMAVYDDLGVRELARIARTHPGWVQPRWRERTEVWEGVVEFTTQKSQLGPAALVLWCLKVSASHSSSLIAAVQSDICFNVVWRFDANALCKTPVSGALCCTSTLTVSIVASHP